ncbi:hypothetical protein DOTSEDRAFT_39592 [Dothistroma septosporum NZE10]|uniref:Uncharacterized protein n=1 Tax=Dothistroma septosporum (strain NZE10 / CBS 128990) TaxID=675120 RepID=M2YHR7_DOTSN|nr:hypothetical protein DOTSEDRAFT_39592 [Dothistroma septosporum NZE10]
MRISAVSLFALLAVLPPMIHARQKYFHILMRNYQGPNCEVPVEKQRNIRGDSKCHTFKKPFDGFQGGRYPHDWRHPEKDLGYDCGKRETVEDDTWGRYQRWVKIVQSDGLGLVFAVLIREQINDPKTPAGCWTDWRDERGFLGSALSVRLECSPWSVTTW